MAPQLMSVADGDPPSRRGAGAPPASVESANSSAASMQSVTPASAPTQASKFDIIRATQFEAVRASWVRRRPLLAAPLVAFMLLAFWGSGLEPKRLAIVCAVYISNFVYQSLEALRAKERASNAQAIFASHLALLTAMGVVLALTGGVASPVLPGLIGPAVGTLIAFGRTKESGYTIAFVMLEVVTLAFLPPSWTGAPALYPYNVAISAVSLLYSFGLLTMAIMDLTDASSRAGQSIERMREDIVNNATQRARSLEAASAKVAHELKNPLTAIKALVQMLERGAQDQRTKERLEVVSDEVVRMETILRDYLSFSRPLEDLRFERVEVRRLVDDVLAVLEARAALAGVSLERDGDDIILVGDPRRLKEALLNLIANAVEATPERGSVAVALRRCDEHVEIVIRDTGKGIEPDVLPKIGTPFFTLREKGTGLGVVLAKNVVKQHGGELTLSSYPGQGTTVTILLPHSPPEPRPSTTLRAS
ncbi:MAG: HAMP domain-containing sensor histidine kinase [Polyangiaceae bacterium]